MLMKSSVHSSEIGTNNMNSLEAIFSSCYKTSNFRKDGAPVESVHPIDFQPASYNRYSSEVAPLAWMNTKWLLTQPMQRDLSSSVKLSYSTLNAGLVAHLKPSNDRAWVFPQTTMRDFSAFSKAATLPALIQCVSRSYKCCCILEQEEVQLL